ncbi:MAG: hypothetical protein L3J69_13935 [Desulfobacula sp.]|nr:hypothetical protein [Desulfobacula sp.]
MTILNENRVKRFKDRLFKKDASQLMQKGSHGLNPIATCKEDANGNIIIPTRKIVDFYFIKTKDNTTLNADTHFSNLYTLFKVFTKEIDGCTFESDLRVSEKEIHEASNKTTIEHLTKNLIISYFNNIKLPNGKVDIQLLENRLTKIVKISSSGRDYRTLVENTLKNLVETLKQDQSWRKCLQDMNDAALVCKLIGSRLPKIDQSVISGFILESRSEIQKYTALLRKILNTKNHIIKEESNQKKYLKLTKKIDVATNTVLKKINSYLSYAHNFMQILGLSSKAFIGKTNDILMADLATLFFGFPGQNSTGQDTSTSDPQPNINYSGIRFRMDRLFGYPELTIYCKTFKDHETYNAYYVNAFKLYFKEVILQMGRINSPPHDQKIKSLHNCLNEFKKAMGHFSLDEKVLQTEKTIIQKKFIALIKVLPPQQINNLVGLIEDIRFVTQDETGEFRETVRKTLVEGCFFTIKSLGSTDLHADEFETDIQKILHSYSSHYKPQRFFYQVFFEAYVGLTDSSPSDYFIELINTTKALALMLVKLFSNSKKMSHLLPQTHIDYAKGLFEKYNQ